MNWRRDIDSFLLFTVIKTLLTTMVNNWKKKLTLIWENLSSYSYTWIWLLLTSNLTTFLLPFRFVMMLLIFQKGYPKYTWENHKPLFWIRVQQSIKLRKLSKWSVMQRKWEKMKKYFRIQTKTFSKWSTFTMLKKFTKN